MDDFFFFFNDTPTTEIYPLSLHDALPIYRNPPQPHRAHRGPNLLHDAPPRSEEHTSELQSPCNLVCRLLLEKKKTEECHAPDRLLVHDSSRVIKQLQKILSNAFNIPHDYI